LMLPLAAVGGFVVPIVFGQLVSAVGFTGGWVFLGVVTAVFAAFAVAGRGTAVAEATPSGVAPDPVERSA
jgi:MFS transporter, ACS family, D-galactonate transporter